ncbi:MAG: ABC transporter ATP-binding protein [Sulfitobacter sp.]
MIKVDIRSKVFGSTPVLGPIAFSVETGETVALVGPSGIGKSTLLRIVAGIDSDFEGQISRPDAQAIVFQEPTLLPWRSNMDNLRLIHPALSHVAAEQVLDKVGLAGKADLFPGQLSLGQQRRLSLARAFAGRPDLLIMDEPFVSLDAKTAETMLELTQTLINDVRPATLFVTHELREADRLADRILTLHSSPKGAVLAPLTHDEAQI